jgi:hypothetical protein
MVARRTGISNTTLGGKPWSYILIPHAAITASATLDGLTAAFRTATPWPRYTEEGGKP